MWSFTLQCLGMKRGLSADPHLGEAKTKNKEKDSTQQQADASKKKETATAPGNEIGARKKEPATGMTSFTIDLFYSLKK